MKFVINNIIKKTKDDKLNLKQRILRHFIETACSIIGRDEYETRGELAVAVAFKQECQNTALLMAVLFPERTVNML